MVEVLETSSEVVASGCNCDDYCGCDDDCNAYGSGACLNDCVCHQD